MLLLNRLRRRLRETGIASFGGVYQYPYRPLAGQRSGVGCPRPGNRYGTRPFSFVMKPSGTGLAGPTWRARCREAAGRDQGTLRIWSAACSTGDEPYTIACSIAASLPNWQQWKIRVLGTDIGQGAAAQVRAGHLLRAGRATRARRFEKPLLHQDRPQGFGRRSRCRRRSAFRQHNLLDKLERIRRSSGVPQKTC